MTFHPAPPNAASSSWMILPLPRTGPSSRCRLQLTTNTRLSSPSRTGIVIAPIDSGSSISPSPRKCPDLAVTWCDKTAVFHVAHEARLVDRHHRAKSHRHGRELPVSPASARGAGTTTGRHRRLPAGSAFSLSSSSRPFQERTRIDARGRMALRKDHVAALLISGRAPEMVETHLVQASPMMRSSIYVPPYSVLILFALHRPSPSRSSECTPQSVARGIGRPDIPAAVPMRSYSGRPYLDCRAGKHPNAGAQIDHLVQTGKCARSGPCCASTESIDSSHSLVSVGSMSSNGLNLLIFRPLVARRRCRSRA